MKQKKQEKLLHKELDHIRQLKNTHNIQNVENRMAQLVEMALQYYQDQMDSNMAQFYFEYGSILVQSLESQETVSQNSLSCLEISKNDRELRDTQLAFENMETAKTILRNKLDKQNIELNRLQELMSNVRIQIQETQLQISHVLIRIGDLQTWREEFDDALSNYQGTLDTLLSGNNLKELSAVHYKLGNAMLLQNVQGCEQQALTHLVQSFRYCYESIHNQQCPYDISSLRKIQAIQIEDELLKMLLEKIEDTYIQLNEVEQCAKEVEKWKQNEPLLCTEVKYLGKVTAGCEKVGDIIIKRSKRATI